MMLCLQKIDTVRHMINIKEYKDIEQLRKDLNAHINAYRNLNQPVSLITKTPDTEIYANENHTVFLILTSANAIELQTLTAGGEFYVATTPAPFAGIDIEYIDNNEPENDDTFIRPRVVIEKPEDATYGNLRVLGWDKNEDYDWQYDFKKGAFTE